MISTICSYTAAGTACGTSFGAAVAGMFLAPACKIIINRDRVRELLVGENYLSMTLPGESSFKSLIDEELQWDESCGLLSICAGITAGAALGAGCGLVIAVAKAFFQKRPTYDCSTPGL